MPNSPHHHPPSVSVLMTVFNAEKYLAASIESILHQTFSNWEFLIVDDASTDQSLVIAEGYAAKDGRIRIIPNNVNKGQTACLNQGLQEARGDFIARQDADDLSHHERLEKELERFDVEPALALLGTSGFIINETNRCIGLLDVPLTHELIYWSAPILNPLLHTSVMFRKNVVQELGGYDESFRIAQDYDLWMRVMAHHQTANLAERLISYRHLESSLSKKGRSVAFEEAALISQKMEKSSFSRSLNEDERALLAAFREGKINPLERKNFWKLVHSLLPCFNHHQRVLHHDKKRLEAIFHLKLAGLLMDQPKLLIKEILVAAIANPIFTAKWMRERFFKTGQFFCT